MSLSKWVTTIKDDAVLRADEFTVPLVQFAATARTATTAHTRVLVTASDLVAQTSIAHKQSA